MSFFSSQPAAAGSQHGSVTPRAWVVFSGQTDVAWLKILRRGFRHCFVLFHDGADWVTMDPMLHYLDIKVHRHLGPDFDLPRWLVTQGHTVMPAFVDRKRQRPAPVAFFSCVEAVKRYLGLPRIFILTPWQLYRYLQRQEAATTIHNSKEGEPRWVH